MPLVWKRDDLIEIVALVRGVAQLENLPHWLVEQARRAEKLLPPLFEQEPSA